MNYIADLGQSSEWSDQLNTLIFISRLYIHIQCKKILIFQFPNSGWCCRRGRRGRSSAFSTEPRNSSLQPRPKQVDLYKPTWEERRAAAFSREQPTPEVINANFRRLSILVIGKLAFGDIFYSLHRAPGWVSPVKNSKQTCWQNRDFDHFLSTTIFY